MAPDTIGSAVFQQVACEQVWYWCVAPLGTTPAVWGPGAGLAASSPAVDPLAERVLQS